MVATLKEKKTVFGYKFVSCVSGADPLQLLVVPSASGNKWELVEGERILACGSMPQLREYVYKVHSSRIELN